MLASFLTSVDAARLPADFDVLELVAAWERLAAAVSAARLAENPGVARWRSRAAIELPSRFPLLWAELVSGRAGGAKARIVLEACAALDDGQARQVDARVAPLAHRTGHRHRAP